MSTSKVFLHGVRDGVPIALGYYTVAFSIGIIAARCGVDAWLGALCSFCTRASAGEFGVYSLVFLSATYAEVIGLSIVANLRYLLMSTALTQKFRPGTSLLTRVMTSACVTDEVFGISIAYPGFLDPAYTYGAALISSVFWGAGTATGIIAGDILPANIVSALSVALFGMFIAIIIPPTKSDRGVLMAVVASFVLSGLCAYMPYVSEIGSGSRTIILTIVISAVAAYIKPIKEDEDGEA